MGEEELACGKQPDALALFRLLRQGWIQWWL
jgi:hypothetical protein